MNRSSNFSPSANNFRNMGFVANHIVLPILVMLPLLLAFEITDWDIAFTNLFFDAAHRKFPLSSQGATEFWLHDVTKELTHYFGILVLACYGLSWKVPGLKPYRTDFLYVFLVAVLGTGVVSHLKNISDIHCVYELQPFGGPYPYLHLFDPRLMDGDEGRCWPASHASCGFVYMSLYFVAKRHWPTFARPVLCAALVVGALYSTVRLLQGQHFLSHDLWAGFIVWMVACVLALVVYGNPFTAATNAFSRWRSAHRAGSARLIPKH